MHVTRPCAVFFQSLLSYYGVYLDDMVDAREDDEDDEAAAAELKKDKRVNHF